MVGWNYRLVGVPDPIVTANLRWLAGYRHPRHDLPDVREVLRRVFVTPTPLMAGTAAAGDPIAVLPGAVSSAVARCAGGRRIGAAAFVRSG